MRTSADKRGRLIAGTCLAAVAAAFPLQSAHAQQSASPFRPERFDEDWSNVDEAHAPFGAQFKNMHVAPGVTLSVGGDARWRFSVQDAPRMGLGGAEADEWILQRLLLHADLRLNDDARVFVQIGAHDGIGRKIPSSSDDNGPDLQQAFVEAGEDVGGGRVTVRVGRQELALGPRFATTRDSGNVRQRHNMVRVAYKRGQWRTDAFAGSPITDSRGAFDDRADDGQAFYGAHIQRTLGATTFEAYAYELDRDTASLTGITTNDDRISIGARGAGRAGTWDFDAEATYQTGSFGPQEIRALGIALDVGRHFEGALSPRVGARFTYGSGDADLSDTTQGTFSPPFPSAQWFGQNGVASFSNLVEGAALVGLAPREDLSLTLKFAAMWRAETADFVYNGAAALAGTSGGDDAYIGMTPSAALQWRANENVTFGAYTSYVFVGDDLHARGAHDVAYAHLTVALRF